MPPVNLLLHVDLVVRDLERSMAFYLRHLGATVAEDAILRGPVASFYSRGTTDAIRVAFLRLPAGRAQLGHMIELIEVVPKDETALLEAPATASRARFDIRNFTVAVEDIEGTVAEMKRQGVEFLTDILPADLPKLGRSRVAFLADPDGNVVELIEALGLELPKATPEASSGAPLSSADRQFLAGQFNNTDAEFPRDKSFIQLFEEQAERTPEAVAIEHGNMRLTYRELNGRANRWAELLTQLGVGPDAVVPILGERGISLCVSIIAAWKAGAAYLPLDPKHPPDRISQVLEQVSFRAVVVARAQQPLLQQALSQQSLSPAILVMEELPLPGEHPNPPALTGPHSLSYVIFTSGSTGAPKGAMVEQLGMVNHLWAKVKGLQLTAADVVAQTASQCFDISVWQFFSALAVGGKTVILGDEIAGNPAAITKAVESGAVTVLELVPSILSACVDEPNLALKRLRWMIATGEALPSELCRRWFAKFSQVTLVNAYGPTECSDDVTHAFFTRPPEGSITPIGSALPNVRLYVLDDQLDPVPVGTRGELYVAGICVGRGYVGRPDLTSERFVPDPFFGSGERMYRTGDVVLRLDGGALEFSGRVDFQVKVRGYRIELGEIEARLLKDPQVREAVVMAREDSPGNVQLVAYLVPKVGTEIDLDRLREALAKTVPEYMVPPYFITVPAFPLTPNGKVDRKALPPPNLRPIAASEAVGEPQTEVEKKISELWTLIRRTQRIGLHENFFDAGGNSISLTQLTTRVADAFDVDLPAGLVFQSPTVAGVAAVVEGALKERETRQGQPDAISPFRVTPNAMVRDLDEVPLSFSEERHFRWWQNSDIVYGRMVWVASSLEGPFDLSAFEKALRELLRRNDLLRSVYVPIGGDTAVRRRSERSRLPLETIDLSAEADPREATLKRLDREVLTPFNLIREPPFKAVVYVLGKDSHLLLLKTDHIAVDAEGWRLLRTELTELYAAMVEGTPLPAPRTAMEYADFAVWQRRVYSEQGVLPTEAPFWKARLQDAQPINRLLSTDLPRQPVDEIRAQRYLKGFSTARVTWNASQMSDLLTAVAQKLHSTVYAATFAAFAALLARRANVKKLVVATLNDFRNRVTGLTGVIGAFNNSTLVSVSLEGDATWADLIRRTHRDLTEIYARPEFPLIPVYYPRLNDFFRISFNWIGAEDHTSGTSWPRLRSQPVHRPELNSNFSSIWDLFFVCSNGGKFGLDGGHSVGGDGSLGGIMLYNTSLFTEKTVQSMVDEYVQILGRMLENPDAPVG